MNAEQALSLVDQAIAQLRVTRQDHATLIEAVKVLRETAKSPIPDNGVDIARRPISVDPVTLPTP